MSRMAQTVSSSDGEMSVTDLVATNIAVENFPCPTGFGRPIFCSHFSLNFPLIFRGVLWGVLWGVNY